MTIPSQQALSLWSRSEAKCEITNDFKTPNHDPLQAPEAQGPASMSTWYCIRTATRQERKVIDGLRDMAHEHAITMDAYLPCETRWNRLARVKRPKQVPMLPGYLFLSIGPENLWRVNELDGVYQILGLGGHQSGRDVREVEDFVFKLRHAEQSGAYDRTAPMALNKGDRIKIGGGQFAGIMAEIVERRPGDRVKVLLAFMGRPSPAVIPAKHLQPQDGVPQQAA